MKQTTIILLMTLSLFTQCGQETTNEQENIISDFIDCFKSKNKEKLIAKIYFPLNREFPIPPIKNRREFLDRYNEVFDDKLIKLIINSTPSKDWSIMGSNGIMLFSGDIWLNTDGKLISVNYQSSLETKMKKALIKAEKSQLHETIQHFKKSIILLETTKYRVRIDDLGDDNYRYASWKLENKMSELPDLVIQNGILIPDGSGGNHHYEFTSGEYKYECSINILGEYDSPPAFLTIFKGDKELSSVDAIISKK